jgi:hypothetical protein
VNKGDHFLFDGMVAGGFRLGCFLLLILSWAFGGPTHAVAASAPDAPSAAVFLDTAPGAKPDLAREIAADLSAAGYAAEFIGPDVLTNTETLRSHHFQLLALPHAVSLPLNSMGPVGDYLRGGGNLIALGLPAWDSPTFSVGGKTFSKKEYEQSLEGLAGDHTVIDFSSDDMAHWSHGVGGEETKSVERVEPIGNGNQRALHATIDNLGSWDVMLSPQLNDPFPGDRSLTCFRARGSTNTREMSIEWDERDGSRWIAVIELTPGWKSYCLPPEAFHYWQSSAGRGGRGDHLNVRDAHRLSIGLARSHSAILGEHQEYWVGNIGSARSPFAGMPPPSSMQAAPMDTLCPAWKFFPIHGPITAATPEGLAFVTAAQLNIASEGDDLPLAIQPRPRGPGFNQERPWRWQPLLEARSPAGDYRGALAALLLHKEDEFAGGIWACFTPDDVGFYQRQNARELLRQTARAMRRGLFLLEGGSEFFTVFEGQKFDLGARVVNFGRANLSNVTVRITVKSKEGGVFAKEWPMALDAGAQQTVRQEWRPEKWVSGGFTVTTELLADGVVIDKFENELNVWRPKARPEFVTERDGRFWLPGKPWKICGVNYMPSTGVGISSGNYFNHWLGKGAYDPEAIDRDLKRIKAMNLNAVSIFVNYKSMRAQHLLDFLRRCDALGLHVNQALQEGTPMNFPWEKIKALIEYYHMAENDTIFAYDLAWEPEHRDQQNSYGRDWTMWVTNRYGSIGEAEKAWGANLPMADDARTLDVAPMRALAHDGPWRILAADYRAFLDWELDKKYGAAWRLVRSIDPHHAVSFRMTEAGDPTLNSEGELPYDFPGLANAVDIWEPEGYGRIGDWNRVRDGRFEVDYARLCDPNKPVMWAETGYSAWDPEHQEANPEKLEFAGAFCHDFLRMLRESGSDGVFFWYYPGGYRPDEQSDFGIINPDGTDRPITRVIREEAPQFLKAAKPPPGNYIITIDRDRDARGLFGIYDLVKTTYWQAVASGQIPKLQWAHKPGQGAK